MDSSISALNVNCRRRACPTIAADTFFIKESFHPKPFQLKCLKTIDGAICKVPGCMFCFDKLSQRTSLCVYKNELTMTHEFSVIASVVTLFDDVVQLTHDLGQDSLFWGILYAHMISTEMKTVTFMGRQMAFEFVEKMAENIKVVERDFELARTLKFASFVDSLIHIDEENPDFEHHLSWYMKAGNPYVFGPRARHHFFRPEIRTLVPELFMIHPENFSVESFSLWKLQQTNLLPVWFSPRHTRLVSFGIKKSQKTSKRKGSPKTPFSMRLIAD